MYTQPTKENSPIDAEKTRQMMDKTPIWYDKDPFVCEKQTSLLLNLRKKTFTGLPHDLAGRTKCHIEQNRFHLRGIAAPSLK
jgi:hypothetical protein